MNTKKIRNSIFLVITAVIWGVAFVAQSKGGDAVGPFSFNCVRSLIGSAVLVPVIKILDKLKLTSRRPQNSTDRKKLLIGGIACGVVLFIASSLQQVGITMGVAAGKAGFLTACYIVLVPILGLFLKKKCGFNVWIGVVFAVVGLYFLCITEGKFTIQISDILLILCALAFSCHILVIDYFSPMVDGVRMSCIQFLVCGLLGLIPTIAKEAAPDWTAWAEAFTTWDAWIAILYAGVMSCGIAYTFQIVGQDGLNPTIASLIMSLESVFSVVAGAVILHQLLSKREIIGCVLVFTAVIFAQITFKKRSTCAPNE